jgi:L-cysteine/cystine lyase
MADPEKLAAARAALPALAAGLQLNTAAAGPIPAEVAAAMAELETHERDLGRAHPDDALDALQRVDEARAGAAAVLGGDLADVVLTHGTAAAIDQVTGSLDWRAGGPVVASDQEPQDVLDPLERLRDRLGIARRPAEFSEAASDDEIMTAFDGAIPPGTRLVVVSHVLPTGLVMPIARIAGLAHSRGALVLVDGTRAAGAIPVSAPDLGVDLYATAAHTWLLGPQGLGALWARHDLLPRPGSLGGAGFHRPSVVGMARAIGWLTMFVSVDFVHRRTAAMAARAVEALSAIDGLEVLTPHDRMAGIVAFRIAGWSTETAIRELAARTFAIIGALPSTPAVQLGVGFWTTEEELERLLDGVRLLATHSPSTIPPRRTLSIVQR